ARTRHQNGVSVGRRLCDLSHSDIAARTRMVFDIELLLQSFREFLRNQARHDIRRACRREGHHYLYGLVWIPGRRYRKNAEYQRGQRNTDRDWPRPRTHMAPPFFVIVALRGDVASGTCIVYGHRLYFGGQPLFIFIRGKSMSARKITRQDIREAAEKYKNWGKWGPNDEVGTLNYTTARDIVAAARLVKKGKVISLALNFDHNGPQGAKSKYPSMGRTNPIHTMLRTGTDAYAGALDKRGIRAADDMVTMPLQCGTQWDGLGHVFYENYMWNGYDCREV